MGTLYHSDENDDNIGPSPWEVAKRWEEGVERAKQERIAHTYLLRCGEITFECYLPYHSPKEGRLWAKIEVCMLPDEMIPSNISRSTLDRATTLIGWHGYIESDFIQDEDGVFVASEHWMQKFEKACERVRRVHKIIIDGEEYHFPITVLPSGGPYLSHAQAQVNGQVFPLRRDLDAKCWVLDVSSNN